MYEALSSSRQQWSISPSKPQTKFTNAKVSTSLQLTSSPSDSVNFTVGVSSPQHVLAINDKQKPTGVDKPTENLLVSEKKSKHSVSMKEEIRGIVAYLKHGAPLDSVDLSFTSSDTQKHSQAGKGKVSTKATNNSIHDMTLLDLDVQNDDKLAEEVKEFVISCDCPTFKQDLSSFQDDLEDWLDLELVDDIDTDVMFDNDPMPELSSVLISDCLGMNHSLNEVNYSSVLDNVPKHVDSTCSGRQISVKSKESCYANEVLEPVDDWNQWNEPTYVERMINLCNFLNRNKKSDVMEHGNNTHSKVKANCSTGKVIKKTQVKTIDRNNHTSKIKRRTDNSDKVKKSVTLIGDHRKTYAHKFAAVKKVPQSSITNKYCAPGTGDRITQQRSTKECCKQLSSSETLQLIVSISFDRLVTERQFKKYHCKVMNTK